jgi:hypothetical protein
MARRLSRARPKVSTLDFAERRGFETEKPWLENARAWVERGRERLAEAWGRAEHAFAAVRERLAGQGRQAEGTSNPTPEQERAETLRAAFRSDAEPPPSDRREALLAKFGQEQMAEPSKDAEVARRQALRDAFTQEKPADRKTAEQLRQAMQENGKPAAERRQGKDRGHEIER